ncbi:hypothetical protein CDAR_49051 [Caerostris darwini]|uniref:Uncharacterized protein n=1 Tax=Caerostris darwini TaxID=1538125 RepID=A0AAV4NI55_9ARAC|nr:hypothetical protein CDAR_49051 [Caerostris darwini]
MEEGGEGGRHSEKRGWGWDDREESPGSKFVFARSNLWGSGRDSSDFLSSSSLVGVVNCETFHCARSLQLPCCSGLRDFDTWILIWWHEGWVGELATFMATPEPTNLIKRIRMLENTYCN